MAFWDYLLWIQLGGKFMKSYGECVKEKQAENSVIDFPDRVFCLGKAIDDTFTGVTPPVEPEKFTRME